MVVNDVGGEMDGSGASPRPADEVAGLIREMGGEALPDYHSVADFAAAAQIINKCVANWGRIDILVNNAGIFRGRMIYNMGEAEWDEVIGVHLKGTFNCCRHACAQMRQQRYGRIVNLTSVARLGWAGAANYVAAKGAIASLTLAVAGEMFRYGVTCNAISPIAATRLMGDVSQFQRNVTTGMMAPHLFQRLAQALGPEYIPPIVLYLASDHAAAVTGQIFECSGGKIALYSEPQEIRGIYKNVEQSGPWTLEELVELVPRALLPEVRKQ